MESEPRRFLGGWTATAIVFLALLLAVVAFRVATQSITCDEALTDQWFVSKPWLELTRWYDANNHVLFTLLAKLSTQALGTSEASLRLPSVLAAIAYFAAVLVLSRAVCGEGLALLAAVAALSLNPFVLDYLCAGRGYGLALAGLMWGLVLISRALAGGLPEPARTHHLAGGSVALGLSVAANLAFAFVVLGLGLAACVILLADGRRRRIVPGDLRASVIALALPGPAIAAAILAPFLVHAPPNVFYAGHDSWRAAVADVAAAWLFHDRSEGLHVVQRSAQGSALVLSALAAAVMATLLTAVSLSRRVRGPRPAAAPAGEAESLFVLVVPGLATALVLHAASHHFFGLLYPYARGGLWVIPLTTLILVLAIALPASRGLGWVPRTIGALLIGGLVGTSLAQFQTSTFRDYAYDSASRPIFERIRADGGGAEQASFVVAAPSYQCPSFNFYRRTRAAGWTASCRMGDWPDDGSWDVRLLRPEERALGVPPGAREMFRDAASGTTVLARGEPAGNTTSR